MQINKNMLSKFHIIYLGIFIIPFQYVIDSQSVFQVLLLGISFVSILTLIRWKTTLPVTYFNIGYILLILYGLIGTFFTRDTTSSYTILIEIVPYFLFCFVLSWYILDQPVQAYDRIVRILKIFLSSTLILSIYTLVNDLNGFNRYTRVGMDIFGNKHTMFTYYLMISISIAVWLYYKQFQKKNKFIYGFIISFLFIICITTAIRKAILIPIIFWLVYVFITSINKRKLFNGILKIILSIAFLVVSYLLLMNNEYFASTAGRRMEGFIAGILGTGESDNSFNVRMLLIRSAIESFTTYPVFGYGFGAFRDYADNMVGIRLYAHNNYLELLASSGVIGFFIYYGIFVVIFKKIYTRYKYHRESIFAFGISLIISFLANDFAVVSYLSLPYMTLISILACLCKIKIDTNIENLSDGVRIK